MTPDELIDFAEVDPSDARTSSAADMEECLRLARLLLAADSRVKEQQEVLGERVKERDILAELALPEAMGDMRKFELEGGYTLALQDYITAKDSPEAQKAMEELDRSSVTKTVVTFEFAKGEDEKVKELLELAKEAGFEQGTSHTGIHNSTLRAELRRMVEEGVRFLRKDFNMDQGAKAVIKHKGKKI